MYSFQKKWDRLNNTHLAVIDQYPLAISVLPAYYLMAKT